MHGRGNSRGWLVHLVAGVALGASVVLVGWIASGGQPFGRVIGGDDVSAPTFSAAAGTAAERRVASLATRGSRLTARPPELVSAPELRFMKPKREKRASTASKASKASKTSKPATRARTTAKPRRPAHRARRPRSPVVRVVSPPATDTDDTVAVAPAPSATPVPAPAPAAAPPAPSGAGGGPARPRPRPAGGT